MRKSSLISSIIILLVISVNSCSFFCKKGEGNVVSKKIPVTEFEEINVDGLAQVYITQGTIPSVEIQIDSNLIQYVDAKVSGKTLEIIDQRCFESITDFKIYITTKKMSKLYADGSVKIKGDSTFKSEGLYINNNGTGDIQLNLDVNTLEIDADGSGAIKLSGRAMDLDLNVKGAGSVDAFALMAKNANATINGAGSCKIYVSEKFNGDVGGSGSITYKGNPKKVNTDITGSGTIQSK